MTTRRNSRRAESAYRGARRDELLRTSAELFARKGFAHTTVRDIGEASGLLSGSLYYYFDTKEAILEHLLARLLDLLWERYDAVTASDVSPREKLEAVTRASLEAVDRYHDEVRIFQSERQLIAETPGLGHIAARNADYFAMITKILADGIESEQFRADLHVDVAFRFIRDTVWPVVRWYRPGGPLGIDEVAEDYLSLLFAGIAAPG